MKKVFVLLFICFRTIVSAQTIITVAGGVTGHGGYWGDGGPATNAQFGGIGVIAVDNNNNLFIADGTNRIRRVNAMGIVTTVAGTGTAGYFGDGGLATNAMLNGCDGVRVDDSNNFYIGDVRNFRIRKVSVRTGIISNYVGSGIQGFFGDGGMATAAQINGDGAFCVDHLGNLYLGDLRRIRKVSPSGVITTIAGTGLPGVTDEGVPATTTNIFPEELAVDMLNNIYFSDTTGAIRKINAATGILTRVAGTGDNLISPYSGDGIVATTCHIGPLGIFVDNTGNIYVADHANSRVEKIDTYGIITSIAGTGALGFSGDNGPATAAKLNYVEDVAVDNCGGVYIADFANDRARKINYPPVYTTPSIMLTGISSTSVGSSVTITATVSSAGSSYDIHWMNHGIAFATTTVPSVTYTKGVGTDTITARIVPTGYGCWDSTTSAGHVVSVGTTGITNMANGAGVMVYPNPAHDVVTIKSTSVIESVEVVNMMGQVVISKSSKEKVVLLDIQSLPAGVYFVKVNGLDGYRDGGRFVRE